KKIAPDMAYCFYDYLGRDPEMAKIINEPAGRKKRLQETFIQWFHEMFTGIDNWSELYAARRWQIGLAHVRVNITPQHVVPAMAIVVREVEKHLKSDNQDDSLTDSLKKICTIDLAFIEQAYVEVLSSSILKETGWTECLFRRIINAGTDSI
ncbi:protoglobin domain-containing protein, partial [Hyella patelloides]